MNSNLFVFLRDGVGLKGWVTFLSSTIIVIVGGIKLYEGDINTALTYFGIAGIGIGLGRKTDKKKEEEKNGING